MWFRKFTILKLVQPAQMHSLDFEADLIHEKKKKKLFFPIQSMDRGKPQFLSPKNCRLHL